MRCYVIDYIVRDFEGAAETYSKLLGMDGVRMSPAHDPSGELDGIHFPVGGLNALGIMTYKGKPDPKGPNYMSRFMATRGSGIALVGHLVDDIDQQLADLAARGNPIGTPEPLSYADGRLIMTDDIRGAVFEFGQHHGHHVTDVWSDRYDAAPNRRMVRAERVDLVTRDLDGAVRDVAAVYGFDGIPATDDRDPDGLQRVDFAVGGIQALSVIAVKGSPTSALAQAYATYLEGGDGVPLLGFVVEDVERAQSELAALGIGFLYDKPQIGASGRFNITTPVHGAHLQLRQE